MISVRWPKKSPIADLLDDKKVTAGFDSLLGEKAKNHYEVNVQIVSPKEIQRLNKKWRQIDRPTDVLSFPLFSSLAELPEADAPIGDLVICPEMVDPKHLDLKECLVHGLLHLLGYDHEGNKRAWNRARGEVAFFDAETKSLYTKP